MSLTMPVSLGAGCYAPVFRVTWKLNQSSHFFLTEKLSLTEKQFWSQPSVILRNQMPLISENILSTIKFLWPWKVIKLRT